MKDRLGAELKTMGYTPIDLGSKRSDQPDDYPDYAHPLAQGDFERRSAKRGMLSLRQRRRTWTIVANRYPGVRAALAWGPEIGELSREHNDSNVLVASGAVRQATSRSRTR